MSSPLGIELIALVILQLCKEQQWYRHFVLIWYLWIWGLIYQRFCIPCCMEWVQVSHLVQLYLFYSKGASFGYHTSYHVQKKVVQPTKARVLNMSTQQVEGLFENSQRLYAKCFLSFCKTTQRECAKGYKIEFAYPVFLQIFKQGPTKSFHGLVLGSTA